ncbi:MAG: hypothetical protein U0792_00185 [Gemmataceae bacterium]
MPSTPATASSPENATFARACHEAGIQFVGPRPEVLEQLGDKVTARAIAQKANVPVLSGGDKPVSTIEEAVPLVAKLGYPVIIKASMGGGGRMRVVHDADSLADSIESARREAGAAFGVPDVFPGEVRSACEAHRSATHG